MSLRRLRIFAALLLAAGALLSRSAAAADSEYWSERFTGRTPGTPVQGWTSDFNASKNVTCTAMVYSCQDSYGYVSMTAYDDFDGSGKVLSPVLKCDFGVYNTLEIKISDLTGQTLTAWSLTLEVDIGLENPLKISLQPGTIGAIGTFDFSLQELQAYSGSPFKIHLDTKLATDETTGKLACKNGFILIHYIRLYAAPQYHSGDYKTNGNKKSYIDLWREDFSDGVAGQSVEKWWDDHDEAKMNATIEYVAGGARLKMAPPEDPSKGYKVSSPGVYWDAAVYPLVRIRLLDLAPNATCYVGVMENGRENNLPWRQIKLSQVTDTEEWVCDVRSNPDWCWPQKRLMCLQLWVDNAEQPGVYNPNAYYDVDYVAISREITPTSLSDNRPTYATPNPFFPSRVAYTTLQFEATDPTADYTIRIFDMKGRLVRQMEHENIWDGRDDAGRMAEGGVYLYQISLAGRILSGQITLIR